MLVYQRVSPVETTSQSRTPLAIGSHAVWAAVWAIDRHIHMIVTPTNCNMPPHKLWRNIFDYNWTCIRKYL